MDRRISYTKMVLKESLYNLLRNKHLSQITVKELCAEADINRSTFYRNYKDIYDMYEKLEYELIESAFSNGDIKQDRYMLLQIIYDNQEFYKKLFYSKLDSDFIRKIVEKMYIKTKNLLKNKQSFDEQTFHMLYQYNVHGMIGVLKEWVNEGCPQNPKEFGDIIYTIVDKQYQ